MGEGRLHALERAGHLRPRDALQLQRVSVSVVDNAPWGVYKDTIDAVVRDPQGAIVLTSFGPKLLKQGDIAVTPADSG